MLKIKPLDHQMQVQYKLVMQDLYMHSRVIANMKMNQAVFVVGTFFGFIELTLRCCNRVVHRSVSV